ncbi:signal recognition particle protein [bacterium]|nr:signal recognition particle protein [bacterium]
MLDNLKERLRNTFAKLQGKRLTASYVEKVLREVRVALLEADVHYKVASSFIKNVKELATGEKILASLTPYQQIIDIVYQEFVKVMGETAVELAPVKGKLTVFEIVGLQGSGKTTHTAKLAHHFQSAGFKVLTVSVDVYRPAAIEQLKILCNNNDLESFDHSGSKPVKIAKKAYDHARKNGYDILIIDTAGRLHIDDAMMKEALAIKKTAESNEIILVVDSMAGQDAANVAREFNELLNITGSILTKLDSDTRGGAALSVRAISDAPLLFAGTGEHIADMEVFHPDRMAQRILGMGDVLSLVEKAKDAIDEEQAQKQMEKILSARFDFNDYLEQMKQINKMGSLESILEMMPGFSQMSKQMKSQIPSEKDLKHIEAMILSMTPEERSTPSMINHNRRKRIAAGSGNSIIDVNRFIKNFDKTKKMMKKGNMKKMMKNINLPF